MEPTKKNAQIAGLCYLLLIITGVISMMYVPSQLIVWDDAAKTIDNISASKSLFQFGIVMGLLSCIIFIMLPLALYRLLSSVNREHALLMVIFAIVSVPISYLNIAHQVDVLDLFGDDSYLKVFSKEELGAQIMLSLESHGNGILITQTFWGLWLFPFGYLVYKSGFLPKFLGIMLMLGCLGYLIDFFGYFLFEGYGKTILSTIVSIPANVGELGICLWLLTIGIKTPKNEA